MMLKKVVGCMVLWAVPEPALLTVSPVVAVEVFGVLFGLSVLAADAVTVDVPALTLASWKPVW
jgi:hypothetical protein